MPSGYIPSTSPAGAQVSPAGGPERQGYAWPGCGVVAVAGLVFGFDIAVTNGAIAFLRAQFHLTGFATEFAVSSLLIGCIAGAAVAGRLSDRYERKRVLAFSALPSALSSLGAALPRDFGEFLVARFIGGTSIGVASMLAPFYIAEVSPARIRGRAMSIANIPLWIASFVLTFTFLSLTRAITITGAFCLYSLMCMLTFVLVWRAVPETKSKTLEEIEFMWHIENPK